MNDIVVLDTNVLVSGLISPHGNPATIIRMILAKKVRIILDSRVFQEYESVLKRPKVGFSPDDIQALLSFFKHEGMWIVPPPVLNNLPDPSDRPFFELAHHTIVPLITGNVRHFPEGIIAITPAEYIGKLKKETKY